MKAASLLFFSSSPLALPLFEKLLQDDRFLVQGLVSAPDAPGGRGQKVQISALKQLALEKGVPVFQPEKLSAAQELLETFHRNRPDFLLTFAYGQLLTEAWLNLPLRAPLNVHPSLLPRHRGPAPIEGPLLAGESETGITLMKMGSQMDAGPLGFQHAFDIRSIRDAGELYEKVALYSAEWIPNDVWTIFEDSAFEFKTQDEHGVTFTHKFEKEDAFEDFKKTGEMVLRRFKAFTPRLGLWTRYQGKRIKLCALVESDKELAAGVVSATDGRIFVGTETCAVEILELQMEGKNKMSAVEFLRGQADFNDTKLPS